MAHRLRTLVSAALAAATAMTSAPAAIAAPPRGFDVKGFVQGMHKSDAADVARRQGYELHDSGSRTVISKGGQADSALFCRDELVSYAYATHGGFMQYLREVKSFEGQGYRRTNLDLGTQMGPDGKEAGHLTIYFFRPEDYYYVTITLLGTEDYDTDNLAIQYEALDKAAKCPQ
jgi:hypothetical protein